MLTGRPASRGTVSETLPRFWTANRTGARCQLRPPVFVRTLLRRCLRKDATKRLHDIADARIELEEGELASSSDGQPAHGGRPRTRGRRAWLAASLLTAFLLGAVGLFIVSRPTPAVAPYVEYGVDPPRNVRFWGPNAQIAVAPDGSLAFVVYSEGRLPMLWVREVGERSPTGHSAFGGSLLTFLET